MLIYAILYNIKITYRSINKGKDPVYFIKIISFIAFLGFCDIHFAFSNELDFSDIEQQAKALSLQNFVASNHDDLSEELKGLDYNKYIQIKFPWQNGIWVQENSLFHLELFHRGYLFKSEVKINIIDKNKVETLHYHPNLFQYDQSDLLSQIKTDIGFAGFRIGYKFPYLVDKQWDEVASFLGASYFRAVGYKQDFGLSARALAINTGLSEPEEFPEFRQFWFIKPTPNSKSVTFFALLDSPSVTGAYQFVLYPDKTLIFDVKSHLYFRQAVKRLGIAPITSMYFKDNPYHQVHDSDGLLIKSNMLEEFWRPLNNPAKLALSVFKQIKANLFGLFQRERNKLQYQDLNYQNRPNLLVEPLNDWGSGAVYLYEIPSNSETNDNIAVFWVPDNDVTAGTELFFDYRLHFTLSSKTNPELNFVTSTKISNSDNDKNNHALPHFVVNFSSLSKNNHEKLSTIQAVVTSSLGKVQEIKLKEGQNLSMVLEFSLDPKDYKDPIELSAYLKSDNMVISETWLYQWQAS